MEPWVQIADIFSLDYLLWALLWSEFVHEIILLLITKNIKTAFKILLENIIDYLELLLLFIFSLLLCLVLKALYCPESDVTNCWSEILLDGLQEIGMAVSENAVCEVLNVESKKVDLLVV